uniref:BPTI/Kunitz inhibitor domain-containing protein n=1 Tax=Seriola dumerili TaxID=41447 RepID=A0A3B4TZE8_SERDU
MPISGGILLSFRFRPVRIFEIPFLPMEEGSCGRYTLRWYFNSQAQACRPFIYSGCEGNDNRFLHLEECSRSLKAAQ